MQHIANLPLLHKDQGVDISGGAPELHEGFRNVVRAVCAKGCRVIDRCDLTILFEPGPEDLAEFLAAQQVKIVATLPCYSRDNVNKQRSKGTFDKSSNIPTNSVVLHKWIDRLNLNFRAFRGTSQADNKFR
ncbi:MAG: hypothetical protein Q7J20_10095 [Candidatus Nitrotoga sp.]|nr:hypothetical protein [Candidatus Nitrotoga sp.]MDO9448223.1 hypothetical protein [Candidatus Nitrotoga sp.]MDP3496848.1 hypothetical protein [Candidatus Nitrotoga sp.]